jgi:cell division protein FtsL
MKSIITTVATMALLVAPSTAQHQSKLDTHPTTQRITILENKVRDQETRLQDLEHEMGMVAHILMNVQDKVYGDMPTKK